MRLPPRTINDRYDVRRAPLAGARTTEETPLVHVLHRPTESVRFFRPRAAVGGTPWRTKIFIIVRIFQERVRARVRTDDGEHSEWCDATLGCGKAACHHRDCC